MPCFRTPFDSQHAKAFQILLKSATQHFDHIFSFSFLGKLNWKISLFLISEILGLFANTLIADHKYVLHNKGNVLQPIQVQLSKKQNMFSQFFVASIKTTSNFEHLKKMTLIAYVFQKLQMQKTWLVKSPKIFISQRFLTVNMLKGAKQCWKLHGSTFFKYFHQSEGNSKAYIKFWRFWKKR